MGGAGLGRALSRLRHLPLLLLALVLASLLGPGDETAHFFWNRVAARMSWGVVALALGAAAAGGLARKPLPWVLVFALGFLPFVHVPQSGIDSSLYAEYALWGARDGLLDMLSSWPERVWQAGDGHLHRHLPAVPWSAALALSLGLPYRVAVGAWSLLLAGAAAALDRRAAPLLLAVPLLWANSGLLLVDVPLCAAVALGLVGIARGRWWWALPAFAVKITAGVFLLGPLACLVLRPWESRRRGALTLAVGGIAVLVLFLGVGHHLRPALTYLSSARSVFVQLTPWLVGAALLGLVRAPPRERWLALASLAGLVVLLRFSPSAHVARYALPLLPALAWAAAYALEPREANALGALGLALGLACWRPLAVHHQAANLAEAVAAIPDDVEVIDIVGAYRGRDVPPDFIPALVQLETDARVQYRGRLEEPVPHEGHRQYSWWQLHEPDPWFLADAPADARLVVALGGEPPPQPPGWTLVGRWDRYRASSFAFPDLVLLYVQR